MQMPGDGLEPSLRFRKGILSPPLWGRIEGALYHIVVRPTRDLTASSGYDATNSATVRRGTSYVAHADAAYDLARVGLAYCAATMLTLATAILLVAGAR